MGGVVCVLMGMYCKSGCKADVVQGALTFFPPNPPCYTIVKKEKERDAKKKEEEGDAKTEEEEGVSPAEELELEVAQFLDFRPWPWTTVAMVQTAHKSRIPVVLFRKRGAKARYTVIYSHGNAADIGSMAETCVGIATNVAVNVVIYDYTGYGMSSSGAATARKTYADLKAVYQWTKAQVCEEGEEGDGADGSHGIILYGQSVGSGPTCYMIEQAVPIAAVVLHSPIMSGMRVLTESRALSCLDIYPNIDRIGHVKCPVWIIHGKEDEEVLWAHGKKLHDAVPNKYQREPWWCNDRGHNDIVDGDANTSEYYKRFQLFTASLAAPANK